MSDQEGRPLQGIVALYAGEKSARLALSGFWHVARRQGWSAEVTALRRAHDGRLRNDTPHRVWTGVAATEGGMVGALVGLLVGPIGWLALVGTVAGGATAWFRGKGAIDAPLRNVGERLTAGTSALIAVVERERAREVERWFAEGGADLITDLLAAETVADLKARSGSRMSDSKMRPDVPA
jgi:uncharacterized membrane protein